MKDNVVKLSEKEIPQIIEVLCNAFYDYPVMRFILHGSDNYDKHLQTLIRFFSMARILRHETVFGIYRQSVLAGVALTSFPAMIVKIPRLSILREETWAELGRESRERYEKLGRIWADLDNDIPNIHLNMLAVRRDAQGAGNAGRLLRKVHEMSHNDKNSRGVTLTTEDPQNIAFYKHFGYRVTGQAEVADGLHTWNFFRED